MLTYQLVNKLPNSEEFGLKSQMKRAIVSVMSNFVEGYLKSSKKEKVYFLEIATTSILELEAQSEICLILNFWTNKDYEAFEEKRKRPISYLDINLKLAPDTFGTFDTLDTL